MSGGSAPRLKALLSAYYFGPDRGSEHELGWQTAREIAKHHDVWVLTTIENREAVEAAARRGDLTGARVEYVTRPRWRPRRRLGSECHHYLWQLAACIRARRLHAAVGFDLVHHVTMARYWTPTLLWRLGVPLVWGPVGGGETTPFRFWRGIGPRGALFEAGRWAAQRVGELDPLVQLTARRSSVALAATVQTADRLHRLGARSVELMPVVGVAGVAPVPDSAKPGDRSLRAAVMGRLLHWKGFHLALRALAGVPDATLVVIGGGPERGRLERLTRELGLTDRVRFLGLVPREQACATLAACDVLLHPSFHDAGGMVCTEAMAHGVPVICLARGGPALQVDEEVGISIPARTEQQVIADLAEALRALQADPGLRRRLGGAARERAGEFSWVSRGRRFAAIYSGLVSDSPRTAHAAPERAPRRAPGAPGAGALGPRVNALERRGQ